MSLSFFDPTFSFQLSSVASHTCTSVLTSTKLLMSLLEKEMVFELKPLYTLVERGKG